jgi:hypothetical protein
MRIASRNITHLIVHQKHQPPYEEQFGIAQQTTNPCCSGIVYTGHVHEKKALNMTAVFYQTARVQV